MPNPIQFLKEVQSELKKVVWPSRSETLKITFAVIGLSLGVALFLGVIDYGLTKGFEFLINR
ncbi:MAG: preprotein translocase subunit SecE [Candidatus Saccharibacteria bacterium]